MYEKFLITAKEFGPVVVISTPLPTIGDDKKQGKAANLRTEISVSQRERMDLTLKFNMIIREFCENNDIVFIDLDRASIGVDGLVDPKLKNKKSHDHHYDKYEYAKMISNKLYEAM